MDGKTLYVRFATNVGALVGDFARGAASAAAFGVKVDASMERLEKRAMANKKAIRDVGNVAGGIGLLAAAGIGVAIARYADFDKQMSAVQAATHATEGTMNALRSTALSLGASTKFSATEAAQGIEELAKAGVDAQDILGGALKGSLDLAAAGDLSVASAAEIVATAKTQFGLLGSQIPHLADLLAAGAGKAQGSVEDLGAALNQSGLVVSNMGVSVEDATGSLAAFASAGLIGSDAGTSFKTAIQRLQAPMGRGAKALEEYGISAYDAQGRFVGITEVAGQLQSKLKGLTQQQRDAALAQIFGADAIRVGTIMYRNGAKGMQEWIDKTNDAGYAAETARLRTDNLSGDVERLGGALDSLFIGMGSGANGPMRELVQMLDAIVSGVGALPQPVLSTLAAALALTAAFGGSVFVLSRMVGAVGATRASLAMLKAEALGAAGAVRALDKATLMRNVGRGAAGLAGMAVASGALGDAFGFSNTAAFALMGTMAGPMGAATGAAVGFIMDVTAANNGLWESFNKTEEKLSGATTFRGQIQALKELKDAQIEYNDISALSLGGVKEGIKDIFGDNSIEQTRKRYEAAAAGVEAYQGAVSQLMDVTVEAGDGLDRMFDPKRAQQFADEIGPVLAKAGLDLDTVLKEGPKGEHWGEAVAAINEYRAATETTAGKQKVLQGALASVDNELFSTAQSADDLAKALQGLFSPAMDQDRALIAWKEGLANLRTELQGTGGTLTGFSDGAIKARTAVMDQVDSLTKVMTTSAAAGESTEQLATRMQRGRQAIIDAGVAAGYNADQMSDLLTKYGLTPELVETLVKANGVPKAKGDIGSVQERIKALKKMIADPKIRPSGLRSALTQLAQLVSTLDQVDGYNAHFTVTKDVHTNTTLKGMLSLDGEDAYGNILTYARGGGRQATKGYRAGIYRAGQPIERFAEPSTQGESYIPWAMDRRTRSTKILRATAEQFGYDLAPRGMGGSGYGSGGTTTIVHEAPLVAGGITVPALPGQDAGPVVRELTYELRRIQRGGRYNR